jgi:uncharacterized coiled-coil DUF342 family protein
MTQEKQITKLQTKINNLKQMKKSARLLLNRREKIRAELTDIRKELNNIRFKVYRCIDKSQKIKE